MSLICSTIECIIIYIIIAVVADSCVSLPPHAVLLTFPTAYVYTDPLERKRLLGSGEEVETLSNRLKQGMMRQHNKHDY